MKKSTLYVVLGVVVLVGAWYLFRPELLFVKTRVDEAFPVESSARGDTMSAPILEGHFHAVAHETTGKAEIYPLGNGGRVLRLTKFQTSNGPDVRVYLVAARDAGDSDTVKNAGFIELGKLKGTEGDQNYEIPADADLDQYRAVTIWCARFGVNFGTAPLVKKVATGPTRLSSGRFHSVAHETKGTATVYELEGGERLLRFADFMTSNGPDVRVYLVAAADASDNDTVKNAGFIELGKLKGTEGDQNYEIPASIDLAKYRAVTIWCARFGVNFGTAPLGSGKY